MACVKDNGGCCGEGDIIPDYDYEVESNRCNKIINFFFVIQLWCAPIAAVVVGFFVMRPGVAMSKFETGECSLSNLKFEDKVSCDCGKGCRSSYPCYVLLGEYTDSTGAKYVSTVYMDIWANFDGCTFRECQRNSADNYENVYKNIFELYQDMGFDSTSLRDKIDAATIPGAMVDTLDSTRTKNCWGDKKKSALFEGIDADLWIGCGAIPLIWLVLMVVLFTKFGTPAAKKVSLRMAFLPIFLIIDYKGTCHMICHRQSPCSRGYACT